MIESVSRRAFITSSGSYNVRASEQAKERRHKTLSAVVLFLDDSQHTFQIDVSDMKLLLQTILYLKSAEGKGTYLLAFMNIYQDLSTDNYKVI